VGIQGKFVAEITRDDILELVASHAPEDVFLDFKEMIFHPGHTKPNDEIEDLMTDLTAFANAFGGHIVVGIQDEYDRARELRPIPGAEARRLATKLKALAMQHIEPPIILLDVAPFSVGLGPQVDEWVAIVRIPEGQSKPHMSAFSSQTRFVIRDGHAKRPMTADEIRDAFLAGPQQRTLANLYTELKAVRALVESRARPARSWWKFW
jgi:predicted HTH transcriptional regulator